MFSLPPLVCAGGKPQCQVVLEDTTSVDSKCWAPEEDVAIKEPRELGIRLGLFRCQFVL